MSNAILEITKIGWSKAVEQENNGFKFQISEFSISVKSMPDNLSTVWGTIVYRATVTDYTFIETDLILFTCNIPSDILFQDVDSIALYLPTGEIFAQGFLGAKLSKLDRLSDMDIYLYLNSPESVQVIRVVKKERDSIACVNDYSELPVANIANRGEYIVYNGHCGNYNDCPEYFPTLVVLSSIAPKTPLYVVNQPFFDIDTGALTSGTYTYQVTATNATGETLPSPKINVVLPLSTIAPVIESINIGDGDLATATYDYKITAIINGGESLPSALAQQAVVQLAAPSPPTLTQDVGNMVAGDYSYVVTTINANNGETLPSTEITLTITEDKGVKVTWLPVAGAVGYRVYGRKTGDVSLLYEVDAAVNDIIDWGDALNVTRTPPTVATTSGVLLTWTDIPAATAYRIYGRSGGLGLLLEVLPDVNSFLDNGTLTPGVVPPVTSTINTGINIQWSKVLGATGYKVYGRVDGLLGLLTTLGDVDNYLDDGTAVIGAIPPITNTSSELEWQLLDGTLIFRGGITVVNDSVFTIAGYVDETYDLALLSITLGTGRYQTRHVRYDADNTQFILLDKPFSVTPDGTSVIAIWASPGCCGSGLACNDLEIDIIKPDGDAPLDPPSVSDPLPPTFPPFIPPPDPTPSPNLPYVKLGVHFSGNFLGVTGNFDTVSDNYDSLTQQSVKQVGSLDPLFVNTSNEPDFINTLAQPEITPHGNRLPLGSYTSTAKMLKNTIDFTFDAIAIPPGLRLIIFENEGFTGTTLLDQTGPYYLANFVWINDKRYFWALDDFAFQGLAATIFPQSVRFWSTEDMHDWGSGSIIITNA